MNQTIQRLCAWSGAAFVPIMTFSLIIMGFLPPLPASLDASQVAAHYEEHRTMIRLGGTLIMQASMLVILWVVAISVQLRRIEQGPPVLSTIQLVCGVCANLLFTFVAGAWTVAAFRPEHDPSVILAWTDFGWFLLLMPVTVLNIQAAAIGLAILSDASKRPLFPRWVGYYNLWTALLFVPGFMITFFKFGPFARDGILVFWLALVLFSSWMFVMGWAVDRAIRTPDAADA